MLLPSKKLFQKSLEPCPWFAHLIQYVPLRSSIAYRLNKLNPFYTLYKVFIAAYVIMLIMAIIASNKFARMSSHRFRVLPFRSVLIIMKIFIIITFLSIENIFLVISLSPKRIPVHYAGSHHRQCRAVCCTSRYHQPSLLCILIMQNNLCHPHVILIIHRRASTTSNNLFST